MPNPAIGPLGEAHDIENAARVKSDGGSVRVTILGPFCPLNWRVRIEEPCVLRGHKLAAGSLYIAGKSQFILGKV